MTTTTQQSHSHPAPLWPRPVKNHHILPAISSESSTGCLLVTKNTGEFPNLGQTVYVWLKLVVLNEVCTKSVIPIIPVCTHY